MITGSIVALVTPMLADGSVDWVALERLLNLHIEAGTAAIGAVGTTGESATLNVREHCDVIRFCVQHCAGRIPVVAGTGANSTWEAIELTEAAAAAGADACLLVTPYYNRPTQRGLYEHFKAINDAVVVPQILYNVPARTAVDMSNDTVLRLAELENIVGIKDATGERERGVDLIQRSDGINTRRRQWQYLGNGQCGARADGATLCTGAGGRPGRGRGDKQSPDAAEQGAVSGAEPDSCQVGTVPARPDRGGDSPAPDDPG